jgi:hypothetical protein
MDLQLVERDLSRRVVVFISGGTLGGTLGDEQKRRVDKEIE